MTQLSQNPWLLLQQAANEPDSSELCVQARALGSPTGPCVLKWRNKPQTPRNTSSLTMSLSDTPTCISLAPSGSLAAVGTSKGSLHLLDVQTGQELKSLSSGCDGISTCAFLSDGTICLGAYNGRLELWGLREGCRIRGTDAHKAQITDCCVSPNCSLLATVSLDCYLKLWNSSQGQLTWEREFSCPLNCVTFHPDGQLVATGGWDATVTIVNLNSMSVAMELKGHDSSVHSLSFSPMGNVLAVGCLATFVRLWSWREAVIQATFPAHRGCVSTTHFLLEEQLLLTTGEDSKVQLWPGHLGHFWGSLGSTSLSPALCVAPNPAGTKIAVGYHADDVWVYGAPFGSEGIHCEAGKVAVPCLAWLSLVVLVGGSGDGSLRGWDLAGGVAQGLWKLQAHEGAVTGLAATKTLLASVSEDFTIRLWQVESLKQPLTADSSPSPFVVLRGHTAGVTCCAFSLDANYLATGGRDRTVHFWRLRDPQRRDPYLSHSLPFCHRDWISSCAWLGFLLLTGSSDGTVCLWEPQSGRRMAEFLGHQSPVCSVVDMALWLNKVNRVVAVGRNGTLVAWDLKGTEITQFQAHPGQVNHCACFREPGKKGIVVVTAGSDGTAQLWSPLLAGRPQSLLGHCAPVCGAAVAPSRFLTVSGDGTVWVRAVPKETGGTRDSTSHHGGVSALAWSPDGEFAMSGGEHGELVAWHRAKPVGTAKTGPHSITALTFTSPRTVLVASNSLNVWEWKLDESTNEQGAVSLTHRRQLGKVSSPVTCVGGPGPHGRLVLGLANGDVMLLPPDSGRLQSISMEAYGEQRRAVFDVSVAKEDRLLLWYDPDMPELHELKEIHLSKLVCENVDASLWSKDLDSCWFSCARIVGDSSVLLAASDGTLWTQTPSDSRAEWNKLWSPDRWHQTRIHSEKISALHVLESIIITAAHDCHVKIWDRVTMKLLGQFQCDAPILCLQPCPVQVASLLLAVGDDLGNVYFLEWGHLSD
uniref:Uncharacterized protein n=1 Tax=Sphenodon punctatus TaxID=8508 RepID=A0A8D0L1C8_SPHPU